MLPSRSSRAGRKDSSVDSWKEVCAWKVCRRASVVLIWLSSRSTRSASPELPSSGNLSADIDSEPRVLPPPR
ncbi:protein lchn-like [Moniliophthora roreri]|nr:protein lchn-like [Moniliophthora roreri]